MNESVSEFDSSCSCLFEPRAFVCVFVQCFASSICGSDSRHLQVPSSVRSGSLGFGFLCPLVWTVSALCPRVWGRCSGEALCLFVNCDIKHNKACLCREVPKDVCLTGRYLKGRFEQGSWTVRLIIRPVSQLESLHTQQSDFTHTWEQRG